MKATEQYFHVVLFIMLYEVVLICKSVNETLVCDHSNQSYRAVLSYFFEIPKYKIVILVTKLDLRLKYVSWPPYWIYQRGHQYESQI